MTRYMVIEHFRGGNPEPVFERFNKQGRMLPDGLEFIESWLTSEGNRCFQLMETQDRKLFDEWTKHWNDLVEFEIIELGNKPE